MKNLVCVWLLGLGLLLVVTADTRAAAVGYFDIVMNGSVEKDAHPNSNPGATTNNKSSESDLDCTMISIGALLKQKYKVGVEYGFGETSGADLSLWSVKGGYRLVDKRAFKLDGLVAPISIETDTSDLRSYLYGLETTVYFSKKAFLTGSYMWGDATYTNDQLKKDSDVPMSFLRLKLHYFLGEKIGVVAGYTKLQYEFDFVTASGFNFGQMDVGMGGPMLGMIYKF